MYADPAQIRAHELKIWLNDSEAKLLDALVEYTGDQRAVIDKQAEAIANAQKPAPFYEWMKHGINERA